MSNRYLFIELAGGLLERPAGSAAITVANTVLQADCIVALTGFRQRGYRIVLLDDSGKDAIDAELWQFIQALLASQNLRPAAVCRCRHDSACDCALPGIGLVADFIADSTLDRARSVVVGDRDETLALARAMGLTAYRLNGETRWSDIAHRELEQPRTAEVRRTTRETDITVRVDLDRQATPHISTGLGFFDHMLEQLGKHGGFALSVDCAGDLEVDEHHTVEDVALAVGQAIRQALGDKLGIARYGFLLPMDEAETRVSIDLSGRAYFVFDGEFPRPNVGGLPTEMVSHFFRSMSEALAAAVHVTVRGENTHHMVEACFKGFARALGQAIARSGDELPSTKGTL